MSFAKGAPGCCCCQTFYIWTALRQTNLQGGVDSNGRYLVQPSTGSSIVAAGFWLDLYHRKWFRITSSAIHSFEYKIPENSADVTFTTVIASLGSSFAGQKICSASVDEKLYYVMSESPLTTTYHFCESDFDGSNNAEVFTRTMSLANANQVTHIEHCRANDMLYYIATKAGDVTTYKVYRCNRDGTNDSLVWAPGTGETLQNQTGITFDNVREKLYLVYADGNTPRESKILRMDLDGTNIETVYTAPVGGTGANSFFIRGVRYSHSKDRLYFTASNNQIVTAVGDVTTDANGGLYTTLFDGTQEERLAERWKIRLSFPQTDNLNGRFHIGCGFERMGSGTEG